MLVDFGQVEAADIEVFTKERVRTDKEKELHQQQIELYKAAIMGLSAPLDGADGESWSAMQERLRKSAVAQAALYYPLVLSNREVVVLKRMLTHYADHGYVSEAQSGSPLDGLRHKIERLFDKAYADTPEIVHLDGGFASESGIEE